MPRCPSRAVPGRGGCPGVRAILSKPVQRLGCGAGRGIGCHELLQPFGARPLGDGAGVGRDRPLASHPVRPAGERVLHRAVGEPFDGGGNRARRTAGCGDQGGHGPRAGPQAFRVRRPAKGLPRSSGGPCAGRSSACPRQARRGAAGAAARPDGAASVTRPRGANRPLV